MSGNSGNHLREREHREWLRHYYAWFTFSSRVLVEIFSEMWMEQGTHKYWHSHSCAKTTRQSWNILISFDLVLIYWHVSESFETKLEQVESVEDEMNVPFTLSFSSCPMLSRRECKPDISIAVFSRQISLAPLCGRGGRLFRGWWRTFWWRIQILLFLIFSMNFLHAVVHLALYVNSTAGCLKTIYLTVWMALGGCAFCLVVYRLSVYLDTLSRCMDCPPGV